MLNINNISEFFGIGAGALSFVGFIVYYVSILTGKTIPNRATWFILTIVGILIASSYYSLGARETIWVAVCYILGPFITFLMSLKYGEGGWNKFDKLCLILAFFSLILWILSSSALITLLTNIFIDLLGILPTIKKSYLNPSSEYLGTWVIDLIASILNILAINHWVFSIYIYPLYMIIFNGILAFLVFIPIMKKLSKRIFT